MTISHPHAHLGGTPPGLWQEGQSAGQHFATAYTQHLRDSARAAQPPSAAGEMNRAFANRVLDVLCPDPVGPSR